MSILKLLLAVLAGYLVLVAFMYLTQHSMLYFPNLPTRAHAGTPADFGMAYEDVHLATADGVRLHGWWVPAHGGAALIFFHGNAGNVSHRLDSIRTFHDLGLSVLIIDYRGYGASEGRPSEEGTYRDAEAAWRHVTEARGVAPERIVLFGRSLGAAVAAWLGAQQPSAGLIVESAFTSVPDLGQELYPFLPVRWLSRFDYPTRDYVRSARSPVLVVHSRDDEIAPFHHGRAIFDAAPEPRALLELRGTHNEAHFVSGDLYVDGLAAFLARVTPPG
jgi:uncharacterized protein